MYVLLGGYTPFEGTTSQLLSIIPTGSYDFHEDYWANISQNAQNLVASLLQVNPMHRATAEQALQSDWMQAEEETLSVTDLSSAQTRMQESIDEQKNARPAEKFRSAVLAVSMNKVLPTCCLVVTIVLRVVVVVVFLVSALCWSRFLQDSLCVPLVDLCFRVLFTGY